MSAEVNGGTAWLDQIKWDDRGLVPVIAQEMFTNRVLMFAWMNRESLQLTVESGQAVYWSRSRNKLWRKGEESGHTQKVREIRLDCDEDVVLIRVEQVGGISNAEFATLNKSLHRLERFWTDQILYRL